MLNTDTKLKNTGTEKCQVLENDSTSSQYCHSTVKITSTMLKVFLFRASLTLGKDYFWIEYYQGVK